MAAMKLSKQQQQYLAGGAVLLVVGGFLYIQFFWMPISQRMDDLNKQIEDIDAKISKAKQQASRLQHLQDELATLNARAVEAEKRLPRSKSVPDVLVTLSALAQKNKVAIQGFSPGPMKAQQYFIELAYPMTIRGSYHNVGRFFASIALEERIFNIRDVVFPSAGADGEMTVTFTLLTYQYKG